MRAWRVTAGLCALGVLWTWAAPAAAGVPFGFGIQATRHAVLGAEPTDGNCPASTILITIQTDGYGSETTWKLFVHGGDPNAPLETGEQYSSHTTSPEEVCVPAGCYDFVILDSQANGMNAPAGYEIRYNGELVATTLGYGWGPAPQETVQYIGACTPPLGACCSDYQCVGTIPYNDCRLLDRDAFWYEGESCPGCPCPQPPTCPDDPNDPFDLQFCQPSHTPDDDWSTGWSEVGTGVMKLEFFDGAERPITEVHWWGLQARYNGLAWNDCDENNPAFLITFHPDVNGLPGPAVPEYQYQVTATVTTSPLLYDGLHLRQYSAVLCEPNDPNGRPVSMGRGWVGIVGQAPTEPADPNDPNSPPAANDCWFLWLSAPPSDGRSAVCSSGIFSTAGHDLGLALHAHYVDVAVACCLADGSCRTVKYSECGDPSGPLPGDCNCDGLVGFGDIDYFVAAIPNNIAAWRALYMQHHEGRLPPCSFTWCDVDGDGNVGFDDIDPFVALIPSLGMGREIVDECPCAVAPRGACCLPSGACVTGASEAECEDTEYGFGGTWTGPDGSCADCDCEVDCPGVFEPESCHQNTNYGCDASPPAFSNIECGQTICGWLHNDGAAADEDWYQLVLATPRALRLSVRSEAPLRWGFVEQLYWGQSDCDHLDPDEIDPALVTLECDTQTLHAPPGAACALPGTYYLWVSVAPGYVVTCDPNDPPTYALTIECLSCTPLPQAGACCRIGAGCTVVYENACLAAGGSWLGPGTDCSPNPCPGACCWPDGSCSDTSYEGICGQSGGAWQGFGSSCEPNPCGGACCTPTGCVPNTLPGGCTDLGGAWQGLNTDCTPGRCDPGRCCYGNPTSCAMWTEGECADNNGVWTAGSDCTAPCPEPLGENCTTARIIPPTALPYSVVQDTNTATADGPRGYCDHYGPMGFMQNDVWFCWTPATDQSVTFRATPTGYDTIIRIGTSCPVQDTECADDGWSGVLEQLTFDASAGVTYYFQVGQSGPSEGGGPTLIELLSEVSTGACCYPNGYCAVQTEYDCVSGDGAYQGDGTDCDPDPCYCIPWSGCAECISRVVVGTTNNPTACSPSGYGDYTALSTDMIVGQGYPITITIANYYEGDRGLLWVDWDRDSDFEGGSEWITLPNGGSGPGPYTATITPPPGTAPGPRRMRVRLVWEYPTNACEDSEFGETEDYTINVISVP